MAKHIRLLDGGKEVEYEHYIEESVAVYLQRDPEGTDTWVLDPSTIGGLDSTYYDGPEWRNCECGEDDDFHRALADRMAETAQYPDAEDVMKMLAKELGYTVVKNDFLA